jgi:hypothetical protein
MSVAQTGVCIPSCLSRACSLAMMASPNPRLESVTRRGKAGRKVSPGARGGGVAKSFAGANA